ncbi:MAG: hypothetical protein ACFCU5_03930, partial [Pleurocapsa sp.]
AAGASNLLEDTTDEEIEAELTDISTDIPVENYTEQATKLQTDVIDNLATAESAAIAGDAAILDGMATNTENFFNPTDEQLVEDAVESISNLDKEVDEITENFDWHQVDRSNSIVEKSDTSIGNTSLDYIDNVADISLDEITWGDTSEGTEDSTSELLIDFEDTNDNSDDISFDKIALDNTPEDSTSELLVDVDNSDSISEWLDNLDISEDNSDSISEWLDSLITSEDTTNNADNIFDSTATDDKTDKTDDDELSFQFLEDLLEESSNFNQEKDS